MKAISLVLLPLALAQDCDYVEWEEEAYYASRDLMKRVQKPIGVCHTDIDPDISGDWNSSIIFECIAGIPELYYYNNVYCAGEPVWSQTIDDFMTIKGVSDSDYFYECGTGIGCDYLIERAYNLGGNCAGDIGDATTWSDTIHIIGGCDGYVGFELYSFLPCDDDPNNVNYDNYGDDDTCNGTAPGSSSYGYGSCVDNNPRYPICGTADVDDLPIMDMSSTVMPECENNGEILGIYGTYCDFEESESAFYGIYYECVDGEVFEFPYSNGDCVDDINEYVCCQSGPAGSIGGATCVETIDECIAYNGTTTTSIPEPTDSDTGLDCDYVEWREAVNYASQELTLIIQKPIGVCHSDPEFNGASGGSVIFTCTDGGAVMVTAYDDLYCAGDGTDLYPDGLSNGDTTRTGESIGDVVSVCGTGNGCEYIIERQYDTGEGCYGNISKAISWNDTTHIIGGCDGYLGFELYSFLPCDDDPNNVNYYNYGSDPDCSSNDPGSSSWGYGSCDGDYPRYPVCGVGEVQTPEPTSTMMGEEMSTTVNVADGDCYVDGDIWDNYQIVIYGTNCNEEESESAFYGVYYECIDGEVFETDYSGDCTDDINEYVCCQSGPAGSIGGAQCVETIDECIAYNGTTTTFIPESTASDTESTASTEYDTDDRGLDCDYVEWQETDNYVRIVQKPIGVCHSDPSINEQGGSVIYTCEEATYGYSVFESIYGNLYCDGEPTYSETMGSKGLDYYSSVCGTGNGCDYIIERKYDTGEGCYGNISKAVSWNDTIHIIGGCDGYLGLELYSFLPCDDDPNNVNYYNYGSDPDCSSNDPGSSSWGYGSCDGPYPRYPVCGVGEVQTPEPTSTMIMSSTEEMTTTEEVIILDPYCDFVQYTRPAGTYYVSAPYIVQKPVDVCHTDATIFKPGTSVIFSCKVEGGVAVELYDNQLCEGEPDIGTLDELMEDLGISEDGYVYQCGTGNGCDYIIERQYDTGEGCYGNISKAESWNDTIHLVGGCDGPLGFELYSFTACEDNPNNVNYLNYGNASNCNGTTDASSSYGYGSCIGNYPRYPVCGAAEVPDWTCIVNGIAFENGDVIGYIGTTCNEDGNTYVGTYSQCVGGEVVDDNVYNGDCDAESSGSSCCQSGEVGSTGGATCVLASECTEYEPTTTGFDDSVGHRIMVKAVFYAFIILLSLSVVIV